MKPRVFESIQDFLEFRRGLPAGMKIGFVPTMGALHSGHASLLHQSASENQLTVLSIFVNPTQFNDKKDFTNYPKTWDADLALAEKEKVDVVITPRFEEIYPDNYRYKVTESEFSKNLCGAHRPGHFDGVLTIVMKLLNIVRADRAYFGEKDFQQMKLIRDMVSSFFMQTEIIPCPTLREESGLAMSSRNVRLSSEGKAKASLIYKSMKSANSAAEVRSRLEDSGFQVDYAEDIEGRRYVAAILEGVRLIDNVQI